MVQESPEIENDKISKPGGAKTRRCRARGCILQGLLLILKTCLYCKLVIIILYAGVKNELLDFGEVFCYAAFYFI